MHLGSLESNQEARVALGYASSNSYNVRFFRALRTSRMHPKLDIRMLSMNQFLKIHGIVVFS